MTKPTHFGTSRPHPHPQHWHTEADRMFKSLNYKLVLKSMTKPTHFGTARPHPHPQNWHTELLNFLNSEPILTCSMGKPFVSNQVVVTIELATAYRAYKDGPSSMQLEMPIKCASLSKALPTHQTLETTFSKWTTSCYSTLQCTFPRCRSVILLKCTHHFWFTVQICIRFKDLIFYCYFLWSRQLWQQSHFCG